MTRLRNSALGLWSVVMTAATVMAATADLDGGGISACATVLCPTNTDCQVINGAPTCVPIPPAVTCGPATCARGLECCNPSCGVCTKPGQGCTKEACNGPPCGRKTCAYGEKCCNDSCGYCVKPGGKCTMELCLTPV